MRGNVIYNYSALSAYEFEALCRDILQYDLELILQTFKSGRDKGIDLRYSTCEDDNRIIVQAKNYQKSGYSKLLRCLKKEELPKIKRLGPSRYILVTSVDLTPGNKEDIRNALSPFISSLQDIYGRGDLDNRISNYDRLEEMHFKLWLSSGTILQKTLNQKMFEKSTWEFEEIEALLPLFVDTHSRRQAQRILNKEKVVVIAGNPGVGKSTIGKILSYQTSITKKAQFVYIDSIDEGESMFARDDRPQVFYFDDFLGSNYLKIEGTNRKIHRFIKRFTTSNNKFLIITTRSIILNQAFLSDENFSRLEKKIMSIKHNIVLNSYSAEERIRITQNHLYHFLFEYLGEDYLFWDKVTKLISESNNFTPRRVRHIVEYISWSKPKSLDLSNIKVLLEDKSLIWEMSFHHTLKDSDQFLLITLLTLPPPIRFEDLKIAFLKRVKHEAQANGYRRRSGIFKRTIKSLADSFIRIYEGRYVSFFDFSIGDFLIKNLNENKEDVCDMVTSMVYIEQLDLLQPIDHAFKTPNKVELNKLESERLCFFLCKNMPLLESVKTNKDELSFIKAFIMARMFLEPDCATFLCEILTPLNFQKIPSGNRRSIFLIFVSRFSDHKGIRDIAEVNQIEIFEYLVEQSTDEYDLHEAVTFAEEYDVDTFHAVLDIDDLIENEVEELIEGEFDWIQSMDDVSHLVDAVENKIQELCDIVGTNSMIDSSVVYDYCNWEQEFRDRE